MKNCIEYTLSENQYEEEIIEWVKDNYPTMKLEERMIIDNKIIKLIFY